VPAGGQEGLHLLRPLIDGLVPGEAALLAERRHGLDEFVWRESKSGRSVLAGRGPTLRSQIITKSVTSPNAQYADSCIGPRTHQVLPPCAQPVITLPLSKPTDQAKLPNAFVFTDDDQ